MVDKKFKSWFNQTVFSNQLGVKNKSINLYLKNGKIEELQSHLTVVHVSQCNMKHYTILIITAL